MQVASSEIESSAARSTSSTAKTTLYGRGDVAEAQDVPVVCHMRCAAGISAPTGQLEEAHVRGMADGQRRVERGLGTEIEGWTLAQEGMECDGEGEMMAEGKR